MKSSYLWNKFRRLYMQTYPTAVIERLEPGRGTRRGLPDVWFSNIANKGWVELKTGDYSSNSYRRFCNIKPWQLRWLRHEIINGTSAYIVLGDHATYKMHVLNPRHIVAGFGDLPVSRIRDNAVELTSETIESCIGRMSWEQEEE